MEGHPARDSGTTGIRTESAESALDGFIALLQRVRARSLAAEAAASAARCADGSSAAVLREPWDP